MAKVTHRQGKWEERRPHLPPPDRGSGGKAHPTPTRLFPQKKKFVVSRGEKLHPTMAGLGSDAMR